MAKRPLAWSGWRTSKRSRRLSGGRWIRKPAIVDVIVDGQITSRPTRPAVYRFEGVKFPEVRR
jgi:hypothetical protein